MNSILLIGLSNVGDAIMTTPVLERLHQLYPEARLDLVGDRRSSALFTHCPYLGQIIHRDKKQGWRGRLTLVRMLRRTRYDLIVDLRTDGMAYLLRAQRRLTKWHRGPHGPHAVEDHMSIIAAINQRGDIPPTTVWLGEVERTFAARALARLTAGRWLALAPGANWQGKIWPADQFIELANAAGTAYEGVVLLGGAADRNRCENIAQALSTAPLNLAGETSLLEAAAVLERCSAFVGNDSGLGHIAAAVGVPTVTVFGPGRPDRYRPWGPHAVYARAPDQRIDSISARAVAKLLPWGPHALEQAR